MGRGLLAGAFWGALVGVLLLLVAALVLEARRAPPVAEDPPAAAPAPPPDAAPPLLPGIAWLATPPPTGAVGAVTVPDRRGLLPRPAKPTLPFLSAGGPAPLAPASPDGARPAPARIGTAVAPDLPGAPPTPGPALLDPTAAQVPRPERTAPGVLDAPRAAPVLPEPPDPAPPTPRAGPRIAFVPAGPMPAAPPDWIAPSPSGAPQVFAPEARGAFLAAQAAGTGAPRLAYARLGGPADAAPDMLTRIAARARRDGAVAVLVEADAALWAVLNAWLAGDARDLVPVPAVVLGR